MQSIPHIAVLIETSRSYTRKMLRGVRRYIAEHGPWSVFLEMRALDSGVPPWLHDWRGDGILCRTFNQEMADVIAGTGLPAIELRASKLNHRMPFVGVDNRALGKMVAEHLLDRGFRQFGCYEIDTESFFEERRDNYVQTVEKAGCECWVHSVEARSEHPHEWELQQVKLAAWLKRLPKPIGIMACTDQLGFWLLDACNRAGIAVPEEVAVVGVEDDSVLCEMSSPPMSSVQFSAVRTGYEAAALLDKIMKGDKGLMENVLIPPIGITTRGSSDIVAVDDPMVASALNWIRLNACNGIKVHDVTAHVGASRSTLERRMKRLLGRTPLDEITRVKLNLVREMLVVTDLPLEKIAIRSGFNHVQYMVTLFKERFGITPGQYRESVQVPIL